MHPAHRAVLPLLLACAALRLEAQCPDGTPPPCRGARPRGPAIDSATVLVVPLDPVGGDASLRPLGATFAAVVAEALTIGELRGVVAHDLSSLAIDARPRAAARRGAGAVLDGSLIKLGSRVRATVRLTRASGGGVLATTSVDFPAESLTALTDRAAVVMLCAWWRAQPPTTERGGLATTSLAAARSYIEGLGAFRAGDGGWRDLMDSARVHDPGLLMPSVWLALPEFGHDLAAEIGVFALFGGSPGMGFRRDSALRTLRSALESGRFPTDVLPALGAAQRAGRGSQAPSEMNPEPGRPFQQVVALESRYAIALSAAVATVTGGSESLAVELARQASGPAGLIAPAARLLFTLFLDRGDTAAARPLLERAFAADSGGARQARALLASRWTVQASAAQAGVDVLDSIGVWFQWHRLETVRGAIPQARQAVGTRGMMSASNIVPVIEGVLFVVGGQADSARALGRRLALAGGAMRPLQPVPPDSLFANTVADIATMAKDFSDARQRFGSGPPMMRQMAPVFLRRTAREAWFAGVLTAQRGGDASPYLALVDTVAATGDLAAAALALGLRAEIAGRNGLGQAAESLLVRAIDAAPVECPARYRLFLARRFATTGRDDLALALTQSVTRPSSLHGVDHLFYYADALELEAGVLARLGRRGEASADYRAFISLRQDADAPFQGAVASARERLAALVR